ncbi:EpsG family protein [Dolosigranulum pigrum]|uniref:EpsG family protein n=1 Tax=Dolosigranulum pigrum TaxID=29394 RepID=UPI001AD89C27|nr:EpsG family protein [Dolosigranulum pigrum]QTJ41591.1 EpsG family protein [Dolosigranulum pigrum]QTJ54757.1 EpsG family protein [Dolosigranulum pigrum]
MIWIAHIFFLSILLIIARYFKNEKIFIYSSFIYILFVYGQRWLSGTDFPNYLLYYLTSFTRRTEFLYFGLQELLATHNIYFGLFIFLILFIIMHNYYSFFKKIDKQVVMMIALFLFSEIFVAQLSQLRQYVAVSFFTLAFYYMFQQKYFKTVIHIILAAGFHMSAIFMSIFLFLKMQISRKVALILVGISLMLPLINIQFIFNLSIFSRYASYLDSVYNVGLSPFHLAKFYGLALVALYYILKIDKFNETTIERMILNGMLLNILLYGMSFQFALLIRVSAYFKVFEIVFLVYYADRLKGTSTRLIQTVVVLFFLGIFGGIILTDPYDIYPYEFEPLRLFEKRPKPVVRREVDRFYLMRE